MSSIEYISPAGRRIVLAGPGDWTLGIDAENGLSGMVGGATAATVTAVGVPGALPTGVVVSPMTGTLLLNVAAGRGRTADEIVAEVNREFSAVEDGTLIFTRDASTLGPVSCRVRLGGPIALPQVWLEEEATAEVTVPLIAHRGVWACAPSSATGTVAVVNWGDTMLWPTLGWRQACTVTLPSGVQVSLPVPRDGRWRQCSLDPHTSHEVTREDGTVDDDLSRRTRGLLLDEGVPIGKQRDYRVSGGRLSWQIEVLNPWR